MNRTAHIFLQIGIMTLGLLWDAGATLVNGSFESSSLSGWQTEIASGQSMSQRGSRPAGTINIVSAWGQEVGLESIRSAFEGNRFAVLSTLANANFTGHHTYRISLRQELSLSAGATLSGWAFFFNGDIDAQDSAWVKILDNAGNTVATPWQDNSGGEATPDSHHAGYRAASPWTQWSWQVPATGSYTLSFGMTTTDDNNYASYGFFDNMLVSPAALPVPEPSAAALMIVGVGCLLRHRLIRAA